MIQDLYNDSFSLFSYDETGRNNLGQVEKTKVLKLANIPCYATEIAEETEFSYGKTFVRATHRIFCDIIKNISESDVIFINGPQIYVDILYCDNCSELLHHMEIECLSLQAPEVF